MKIGTNKKKKKKKTLMVVVVVKSDLLRTETCGFFSLAKTAKPIYWNMRPLLPKRDIRFPYLIFIPLNAHIFLLGGRRAPRK